MNIDVNIRSYRVIIDTKKRLARHKVFNITSLDKGNKNKDILRQHRRFSIFGKIGVSIERSRIIWNVKNKNEFIDAYERGDRFRWGV